MRTSWFWYGGVWLSCFGLATLLHCGPVQPQEPLLEKMTENHLEVASERVSDKMLEPNPDIHLEPNAEPSKEPVLEQTQDGGAKEAPPADKPGFDPTVCGAKAYKWLPTSEVGKLVSKEKPAVSALSKLLLTGLIARTGYKKFGDRKIWGEDFQISLHHPRSR